MNRRQRRICERLGWNVTVFKNEVELSQNSPAGEDFSFTANKKNFAHSVKEYADNFDADDTQKCGLKICTASEAFLNQ